MVSKFLPASSGSSQIPTAGPCARPAV